MPVQGNSYIMPLAMARYAKLYKIFLNFPAHGACLKALQGAPLSEMEEIVPGDWGVHFQLFPMAVLGFHDAAEFPIVVGHCMH